jgi:hypothetical protein
MARSNMKFGIGLFVMLMVLMACTFVWAAIYLGVVH